MDQVSYFLTEFDHQEWALVGGCSCFLISSMSIYFSVGLSGVSVLELADVILICLVAHLFVQLQYWNDIGVLWFRYGGGIVSGNAGVIYYYLALVLFEFALWSWSGYGSALVLYAHYGLAVDTKRLEVYWFDWDLWKRWGSCIHGNTELWQGGWWSLFIFSIVWENRKHTMCKILIKDHSGLNFLKIRLQSKEEKSWAEMCYGPKGFNYILLIKNRKLYCARWKRTKFDFTDGYIWWIYEPNGWGKIEKLKRLTQMWTVGLLVFMRYHDIIDSVSLGSLESLKNFIK